MEPKTDPIVTPCSLSGHDYFQLGTVEVVSTMIVCCHKCADVKRIPVNP